MRSYCVHRTRATAADTIAKRKAGNIAPQKPQTALFKRPRGSTGHLIGESDEQPDIVQQRGHALLLVAANALFGERVRSVAPAALSV